MSGTLFLHIPKVVINESNYDDEYRKYSKECPYPAIELSPELAYKQIYSWFTTEKVLPSIGKTVLEEFVARHVQSENPELARKLLQMKDVIRGTFEVLDVDNGLITVKHKGSGMTFLIGLLRLHGLVVVGKMPMQGRLFRVVLLILAVFADE